MKYTFGYTQVLKLLAIHQMALGLLFPTYTCSDPLTFLCLLCAGSLFSIHLRWGVGQ